MIKKIISAVTAVITAAVIIASSAYQAAAFDVYSRPIEKNIFLKQENSMNFVFLDNSGSYLTDYEVVMKNSAGVEVGRIYDNEFQTLNSSGITEAGDWTVSEKVLADIASPMIPQYIAEAMYYSDTGGPSRNLYNLHDYSANNTIDVEYMVDGENRYNIYRVFSYEPDEETAFTIPANKIGIFVDQEWADHNGSGFYQMGSDGKKKYFDNNNMINNLHVIAPKKDLSELRFGIDGIREDNISEKLVYYPQFQSKKTEYVKCIMKITDMFPREDTPIYNVRENGTVVYNAQTFNLKKETKKTTAFLTIVSGACVTVAIPDSSGNVVFYVEKNSRQMTSEIVINYYEDNKAKYRNSFRNKGYGGIVHEVVIDTPHYFLNEGIILANIPKGQYILELKSLYGDTVISEPFPIEIKENDQIQYSTISFKTYEELPKGDVDANNIVNSSDASNILAEYAALSTGKATIFTSVQKNAADVNYDGKIDSTDASKVLEHYANIATGGTGTL